MCVNLCGGGGGEVDCVAEDPTQQQPGHGQGHHLA
jgi:hypothetical protein